MTEYGADYRVASGPFCGRCDCPMAEIVQTMMYFFRIGEDLFVIITFNYVCGRDACEDCIRKEI